MIENCPGPEEFTGIAIPILGSQKGSARLADAPGPEEFTGIKALLVADFFIGPIPVVKTLVALGAAGAALLLWVQ